MIHDGFGPRDLGLFNDRPEATLDTISELARLALNTEGAAIAFVDATVSGPHLWIRSRAGIGRSDLRALEAVMTRAMARIESGADAALAIPELGDANCCCATHGPDIGDFRAVIAHPVRGPADDLIGLLCAVETRPRIWSGDDRRQIGRLAGLVATQVMLKAALRTVNVLSRT